ncbi:MAG: peptide chain release factor N(5)-glutamine methyltransferase [Eubacterium sp.]|nr:peptide chain release factor N(5)-glutamine methyltransferase [Eubacterium sp.]
MVPERLNNSLKEWRAYGEAYLDDCGLAEAKTDAWLLLEYVTGTSEGAYYLRMQEPMADEAAAKYETMIRRRAARIPLQYLTGEAWCYGNRFLVNHHVLIPRQDTEFLIEEALKRIQSGMHLLDLCTGSGCVLISLLKQKSVTGVGTDISRQALRVAAKNARLHRVQAEWIESDLFERVDESFDIILSNPPYIPADVIEQLDPEVRDHEPRIALDGGEDGLSFYRRIIREAPAYLKDGGWLCLETGYNQGGDVRRLFRENHFTEIELIQDYAGFDRVVLGKMVKEKQDV